MSGAMGRPGPEIGAAPLAKAAAAPAAACEPPLWRSLAAGAGVGLTDLAFVYPLAVLACRREAGMGFADAVRAGRLWSGAATQLVLVPYSMLVEGGTRAVRRYAETSPLSAALAVTLVVSAGLQPIEKKLVVDQLLQTAAASAGPTASGAGAKAAAVAPASSRAAVGLALEPVRQLVRFGQAVGPVALYKGFVPLALREFIYISAISVVNPLAVAVSQRHFQHWSDQTLPQAASAFCVGFTAGMLSAPVQTVNAMMKDERNRARSLASIVREDVFGRGARAGVHRLFFGAATRSARCGGAGVLYFSWRCILGIDDAEAAPDAHDWA